MPSRSPHLLLATLWLIIGVPSWAQPKRNFEVRDIRIGQLAALPIEVPCCRCLGEQTRRINIATGGANRWSVSGPGVAAGAFAKTITGNLDPLWTTTVSQGQWVHPTSSAGNAMPAGTYSYTLLVEVPNCTIPMQVFLDGKAAADDRLTGFVDNSSFVTTPTVAISSPPAIPAGAVGWGFRTERIASFSNVPLTSGTHVIRFEVPNIATFFGNPTAHGLVVSADIRTVCPD